MLKRAYVAFFSSSKKTDLLMTKSSQNSRVRTVACLLDPVMKPNSPKKSLFLSILTGFSVVLMVISTLPSKII